jgi:hypothetical protein
VRKDRHRLVGPRHRDETDRSRAIGVGLCLQDPRVGPRRGAWLYDATRRIVSTGRSERYTRIEIIGIAARSKEAKRALFQMIADNLEAVGVPRTDTRILLIETQPKAGASREARSPRKLILESSSTCNVVRSNQQRTCSSFMLAAYSTEAAGKSRRVAALRRSSASPSTATVREHGCRVQFRAISGRSVRRSVSRPNNMSARFAASAHSGTRPGAKPSSASHRVLINDLLWLSCDPSPGG